MPKREIDELLRDILTTTKVIAVVGLSPNSARPSHGVAQFLIEKGYRVVPVNPGHAGGEILGQTVYADLASIPPELGVDMVDIFRQSDAVPEIVDEALATLGDLKAIWMQIGVTHDKAAGRAMARGIRVVQDRCPKIEYPRLFG